MVYLAVMAACLIGTLPLELWLGARVYRRPLRLLLTLLPVLAVFITWDVLAIRAGHWHYRNLTGWRVGNLPVEEIVFFLVIPLCALLTFEAVRRVRPSWPVHPEAPAEVDTER